MFCNMFIRPEPKTIVFNSGRMRREETRCIRNAASRKPRNRPLANCFSIAFRKYRKCDKSDNGCHHSQKKKDDLPGILEGLGWHYAGGLATRRPKPRRDGVLRLLLSTPDDTRRFLLNIKHNFPLAGARCFIERCKERSHRELYDIITLYHILNYFAIVGCF